ncbi:P-II family nitrogen regulator [Propionispora vibrioides]|jgi:nitrogen regulatory protein PII 2|uniref:Nitrogen regulatory protein P-II family n=1 Tax=Propionispora vibrioides TaxID=112903 RepID=A0A1H8WZN6_9FIRM|nr:P-II family nitrogen regulator [Propionispora vibrioides]SEP32943.1 nitrogen regulatory protein P-II family [Propionispora vibrioides]
MKEIIAIVRMNKTNATKKALIEAGAAGFTATKVVGRGKMVVDTSTIEDRKRELLSMTSEEDRANAEVLIESFLNGARLFPRRMFNIMAHDQDVSNIVEAITVANRTDNHVGDGKIFVLPLGDVVRVRTGETGDEAI